MVFAGLLLSGGSLGDRLGARRVFEWGLATFTLASAACALAPTVGTLVGARIAQGFGAALLVPSSLALLRAAYEDRRERARAVGAWGAIAGIGAASGPILGGVLVTLISWRAVFVVNVPLGALGLLLARSHLPSAASPAPRRLDLPGQLLGILALASLTFGMIEGGAAGWGSPLALVPLLVAVPAAASLVVVERRVEDPMLPVALFRRPTFSGATAVGLLINLGFYGQLFALWRLPVYSTHSGPYFPRSRRWLTPSQHTAETLTGRCHTQSARFEVRVLTAVVGVQASYVRGGV